VPADVSITINDQHLAVPAGTTVAAALAMASLHVFRRSTTGEPRGPLCGMGICFECRVTIDRDPHCRSCMITCRSGMEIRTDGS
jgi:aerobic-type carbon monoxide dehydrogenase small subunit (CoxS/CutS family)